MCVWVCKYVGHIVTNRTISWIIFKQHTKTKKQLATEIIDLARVKRMGRHNKPISISCGNKAILLIENLNWNAKKSKARKTARISEFYRLLWICTIVHVHIFSVIRWKYIKSSWMCVTHNWCKKNDEHTQCIRTITHNAIVTQIPN